MGLVEVAVLMKALMYKENGQLIPNRTNVNEDGTIDYGLMQLNSYWFGEKARGNGIFKGLDFWTGEKWKTDPFYNIGGGIGMVFNKFKPNSNPPTLLSWFKAIKAYNPGGSYDLVVKYFHWMMGGLDSRHRRG